MCRSIKVLRRPAPLATPEEIAAAALQFVRKVSGTHKPSRHNQPAFDAAVAGITAVTTRLLGQLPIPAPRPPRPEIIPESPAQKSPVTN